MKNLVILSLLLFVNISFAITPPTQIKYHGQASDGTKVNLTLTNGALNNTYVSHFSVSQGFLCHWSVTTHGILNGRLMKKGMYNIAPFTIHTSRGEINGAIAQPYAGEPFETNVSWPSYQHFLCHIAATKTVRLYPDN